MNNMKSLIKEWGQIAIAVLLASIGLKAFLLPNGFLDGGVTGIAILISELSEIELSVILPVATIPFLILGWFTISKRILLKSVISVLALALMIHFENFQPITSDKLIISIFGGIFLGAGIGLAIKNGAVLDGSEIFGIYIHERFGLSIGTIILGFNLVLFSITALLLSPEVAMYSILTYIVTGKVIDFMIKGFEDYVGLMIISKKIDLMKIQLRKEVGQGMTVYNGVHGYGRRDTQEDASVIHTVVNRIDTRRVYRVIEQTDPEAFIIEFDVNQVKGGALKTYLS